jgi:hypothetical protein
MREFLNNIRTDKTIVLTFFINASFIIASAVYILFSYGKLPPFIPIFNQLPWGEQRLGNQITIFIPILASLSILAINLFMSNATYKRVPLVSRMLAATSLLAGILSFLFIVRTILSIT